MIKKNNNKIENKLTVSGALNALSTFKKALKPQYDSKPTSSDEEQEKRHLHSGQKIFRMKK